LVLTVLLVLLTSIFSYIYFEPNQVPKNFISYSRKTITMTGYYAHYYVSFIFVPLAGVILPILAMGLLFNYVEN